MSAASVKGKRRDFHSATLVRKALESAEGTAEFLPDPAVQTTSAGVRIVHLHQVHRGIPVLGGHCLLRFRPGRLTADREGEVLPIPRNRGTTPCIDACVAARAAAQQIATLQKASGGRALRGFRPRILASFPVPSRPTVLHKGPFAAEIPAYLVFFRRGSRIYLAWCLTLSLRDHGGELEIVVRADQPEPAEILDVRSLLASVRAQGRVVSTFPTGSALRDFPVPLAGLPSFLHPAPAGLPFDWVDQDQLKGNCTSAVLGGGTQSFRGTPAGGLLTFAPAVPDGTEQKLVNTFFYTNLMHDFFFALGFDEAAGNFQNLNRTGAGLGGDGVNVRIFNVALNGHATMRGRPDGKHGEMRLGVMPGSLRHTALDPDVVIHEFTHGVTERLVGGPMNWRALEEDQSVALSEGWSDYFALTFQSYGQPAEKVVFGDWVSNSPGGMRHFPYDAAFPRGFGDLGRSPYDQAAVCGEIWCAALMRMNRAIGSALGDSRRGHEIGWQIVVDGLKLVAANPHLLQARDAILRALDDLRQPGPLSAADHQRAATAARAAFAAAGMGPNARANGTSLTGNVAG